MAVFHTTRRVEFRDTDAAGIKHFSTFFTDMEEAEHELLRHAGMSVVDESGPHTISWPRVSAACDYKQAARFEEELEIDVQVKRLGKKSVTYVFRFRSDGTDIATGTMTSVCCRIQPGQPPASIPIPDDIVARLRPYLVS